MFADLAVAVQVGVVLAALLFIRKVARTSTVSRVTKEYDGEGRPHGLQGKPIPDYVTVVRIHGPFLSGATEQLTAATEPTDALAPVVFLPSMPPASGR